MEEFQLNTKIVSGPGAIGVLGREKARRVFLVTDPFFVKNGMADRVVRIHDGRITENRRQDKEQVKELKI